VVGPTITTSRPFLLGGALTGSLPLERMRGFNKWWVWFLKARQHVLYL